MGATGVAADAGGGVGGFRIRPLAADDDLVALTGLLHRAYADLAKRGMYFLASHQPVEETRTRIASGECWVAVSGEGAVVGTIVLKEAGKTRGSPWYDRPDVTRFGQFAVEPGWQGR